MVDFVENKNFSNDLLISYLSSLVKGDKKNEFCMVFEKFKDCIQNMISENIQLDKIKDFVAYYNQNTHGLNI